MAPSGSQLRQTETLALVEGGKNGGKGMIARAARGL